MKKNKITSFTIQLMELEIIMLGEISQIQKDKYHSFSYTKSRFLKNMKVKGRLFGKRKGSKRRTRDKEG
jgi:predicted ribonuclease toxin of YeeF-YezG toxin-antitoxin module